MVPFPLIISAASRIASTLVSADRITEEKQEFAQTLARVEAGKGKVVDKTGKIEGNDITVYDRGKGKTVQPLSKVETPAEAALEKAGQLAAQDTTLDTLSRHSIQTSSVQSSPTSQTSLADVQKALQAGGERMKQASRLGVTLHTRV